MVQSGKKRDMVEGAEQAPSSFDLGAYALSDVATMEIIHPITGEGIGSFIEVCGADSPSYLQAQQVLLERKLKKAKGRIDKLEFDAEEMPLAIRLFAVAVSKRFTGDPLSDPDYGIIPLVPTDELKKKLFTKYPWIAEQIVAYCREREHFFPGAD